MAQAGGFEEHGKLKAQQELVEKMNKMPLEKFFQLAYMLNTLERMFDKGGSDLGILTGITDSITDTITTELKGATSELMNSINTSINAILEPLMPMIQTALNGFNTLLSRGIGGIEALLTGKFDQYIANLKLELQDQVTAWQVRTTELYYSSLLGRTQIEAQLLAAGLPTIAELEAQAIAGGVYSGQFDLDPDALARALADLQIPTFEEE